MGRMDEMGSRMDELERSVADLLNQAGLEPPTGALSPSVLAATATTKSDDRLEKHAEI